MVWGKRISHVLSPSLSYRIKKNQGIFLGSQKSTQNIRISLSTDISLPLVLSPPKVHVLIYGRSPGFEFFLLYYIFPVAQWLETEIPRVFRPSYSRSELLRIFTAFPFYHKSRKWFILWYPILPRLSMYWGWISFILSWKMKFEMVRRFLIFFAFS